VSSTVQVETYYLPEWQGKEIGEKKEWQGKKLEVPVIVHPGASSVQLFTSVTNGKLAHPVGGGMS
jgi:hypothetical protein